MADPNIQVPSLPAASVPDDSDLYHVRQGTTDKKITYADLKSGIDPAEINAVPETRQVNTTGPLQGGGSLTSDLTLTVDQATETTDGTVELATSAETITGTDGTRAVTPAGLATLTSTTTRKGLVEGATDAEADAGTDTERFINSKQLQDKFDNIQSADTVTEGLIRVATVAEAQGLSLDNVAMSPLKMANAFETLKAGDGYIKFPGGLMVQWGSNSGAVSGTRTVTFPVAFSATVYSVNITRGVGATTTTDNLALTSKSATNFKYKRFSSGITSQIDWVAIGTWS